MNILAAEVYLRIDDAWPIVIAKTGDGFMWTASMAVSMHIYFGTGLSIDEAVACLEYIVCQALEIEEA